MEFKLIQSSHPNEFEELVTEKLKAGYIPVGKMQIINTTVFGRLGEEYQEIRFYIGMIKEGK